MTRRAPGIFALGAILAALLPLAAALADDPAGATFPLRYRRVLVPREALSELTRGYLPMKRDEFAARMADIAAAAHAAQAHATWIASAEYTARLEAGDFLAGVARLHIVHRATEPACLPLAPARLATGPAVWQGEPAPRAAIVGTDPAGNTVVQVTTSGVLEYPWTLRGVANEQGERRFALALTDAPVKRLTVDIPATQELLTDQGLVVGVEDAPLIAAQGETTTALRRWTVELGGISQVELTVVPQAASSGRRQLVSVEQDAQYRLESDSLHVTCDIDLDIHNQPLGELQLEADAALQITAVQLGNLDLEWQSLPGSDAAGQVIRIPFAERLTGTHSALRVSAVAALQTQTTWRLPTLRPRQVVWRQGTMSLEVPDLLAMQHLQVHQARQSAVTVRTDEPRTTTLQFELFGPDGALDIVLARRASDVVIETGTTIDLNVGAVTALVVADLRCRSGERFAVQALVPNTWAVDGVETEPAAALHDYQFVAYEAQFKRLQIQLAQPLRPAQSVRLTIRGHRSPSLFLGPDDLRPVQWLAMTHATRLIALVPDTNFRLDLSGDATVERLDPAGLAPADARRLQLRAGAIVFDDDERASRVAVTMAREEPEFKASVTVDVDVLQNALSESYRVVCTPEATPLDRLQIHFSEPRAAEIVWRWVGEGPGILSTRRLRDDAPDAAGLPLSGESWEIVLRTPQRAPFELRGERKTRGSPPHAVSLATLPDAVSHEGQLTLRASDGQRLSVQTQALAPIPCDPAPPDAAGTLRACYRYDASRTARVTIERLAERDGPAALWAWRCRVMAQCAAEGETRLTATYFLENTGVAELRIALPTDSTCQGLDINGEPAPRALRSNGEGSYSIALPAGQRFPRVEIRYVRPGRPLGIWSEVSVELPRVDIPVLDRRVSLWIPPGFRPLPTATAMGREPLPSWTQRLLGPLAARPGDPPASWLVSSFWSWLTRSSAAGADIAVSGTTFLERLGSIVLAARPESTGEPRTWRGILRESIAAGGPPSASVVWVDADLLAQEGFCLEATVPPPRGETPITAAGSVLRQAGLLLVVHRDQLYLTSSTLAARYPSPGTWLADGVLFAPQARSPLAAELDGLEASDERVPVPLQTWTAVPTLAEPPWHLSGDTMRWDGPGSNGRWCDLSVVASTGRCTLHVERPAAIGAIGWCSLVGMAGLIACLSRWRRGLNMLLVLVAAVAMAVPPTCVPLTSSLLLGTLGGLLLIVARARWRSTSTAAKDPPSGAVLEGVPVVAVFVLAVWLALLSGRRATAAAPSESPSAAADPPVYPLVVPVDDNLAPVGQYDYLPGEFYDALHRLSEGQAALRCRWLATQANYHIAFHTRLQRSTLEITTVSASYQLQVLAAQDRLWFPWDGQSPAVEVLEAQWNAQPIELEWNATRTAFAVPATQPGLGTLELVVRVEVREEPGTRQLRCAIPRIARSQLELSVPVGAPSLQVTSAIGPTRVDAGTGVQRVDLGPAEFLDVRWPSGASEETPVRPVPVAELLWLKVCPKDHPESVRLAVRLQLQPASRHVTELTLRVDARLRYVSPSDARAFEVTTVITDSSEDVLMTLRWREAVASETTVQLDFELLNASGLGNIPLPRLETVGTRTTRRWLAVSVAPHLESMPASSELLERLDSAEFLAAWGESESAPQLCYRMTADDPGWSLATRSRQPLTVSRERVDVSVGPDRLDLVFEAELETTQGDVFQHRVTVPRDMQLSSVVLLSGQTDLATPVVHDGSGTITVFLRGGVTGVQYLILRGFLPRTSDSVVQPLPKLALPDVHVRSQSVYVYRQPEILLEVRAPASMTRVLGAAAGRYREAYGRLTAAFAAYDGTLTGWDETTLEVQPNRPQVDARLVVVLQRDADTWMAVADVEARVVGETPSVVDTFRFELPPEWVGPFTLEPALPHEIRALPGQRRQLVIRPLQSVPDRLQLRIRGVVQLGPAERGRTPDIMPLDIANVERFFVLPTRWDQQRIEWTSPGLVEVPLADVVPADLAEPGAQIAYRVWSKPRAVITQVRHEAGERQIALADVHVRGTAEGRWYGVVGFAIQPAGIGTCTLELPADIDLVDAEIDGVPAMLVPLSEHRWQVRLVSDQLAQQLSVVFRRLGADRAAPVPNLLTIPWIADIPVRQTLWTVYRAAGTPWEEVGDPRARVLAAHHESLRLATAAYLVETAAETVLDAPPRDVQAWYTPWAQRLASATARLAHAHTWPDSPEGAASAKATDAVLEEQERIAQRLKVAPTVLDFLRQTHRRPQPQDVWAFAAGGRFTAGYYVFAGGMPALPLRGTAHGGASWRNSLAAAASMFALASALWLLTRCGVFAHVWYRWPQAVGVLGGVTWWLVATPALLGWLVVIICVWSAVRLPWVERATQADSSEHDAAPPAGPASPRLDAPAPPG